MLKSTNAMAFFTRVFFLLWVIVCLSLFMLFTGTVSFIHQFIPGITDSFFVGLSRINGSRYILSLLTSFIGTLLFSLSCTALGVFILDLFWKRLIQKFDTLLELLAYLGTAFLVGEIVNSYVFLMLANLKMLTPYVVGFSRSLRSPGWSLGTLPAPLPVGY